MKLNIYKCTSHPQYKPNSEIIIAHKCYTKAIEMAENIAKCTLSIEQIGSSEEYEHPLVIKNAF